MPANKFHYVYVLVSEVKADARYVGYTEDIKFRLRKHNAGGCPHTAKFRPWRIETCLAFHNQNKALAFEAYLKSGSGREFARRHF